MRQSIKRQYLKIMKPPVGALFPSSQERKYLLLIIAQFGKDS
jgi:hypothetical protein